MSSVTVNPPKTPVTKGSSGVAMATVPNVCKMPGPPAPFVPTPLPNIGKSGDSPSGYSTSVTVEGNAVAIQGASFNSTGDVASQGTGGGIVSNNVQGPTKFVAPGSMDVKIEGKNVQLLGDQMSNNNGPGGSPPNAATMVGVLQPTGLAALYGDELCALCGKAHGPDGKLEETADTKGDSVTLNAAAKRAVAAAEVVRKQREEEAVAAFNVEARRKRAELIATYEGHLAKAPASAKAGLEAKIAKMRAEPLPVAPRGVPASLSTMLGVVRCKDAKVYAGKSVQQLNELEAEIPGGWHTPPGAGSIVGAVDEMGDTRARYAPHVGNAPAFDAAWDRCDEANKQWRDTPPALKGEPFYPPGQCAAQQMVVLALDHGGRPVGLTERWFSSGNPAATVLVYVRDTPASAPREGQFGGENAVPPCGTCQVILSALMCPEHAPKECAHKSPPGGACRTCG